jgi:hypothetical protein
MKSKLRCARQDDAVRSLLRETAAPMPLDTVDWHALHERIMADAASPVPAMRVPARRVPARRVPAGWALAARWAAVAIPIGTAAGFAATLALARLGTGTDVRPSVVAAIRGEVPVATVADRLVSPDAERWVMAAVVGE